VAVATPSVHSAYTSVPLLGIQCTFPSRLIVALPAVHVSDGGGEGLFISLPELQTKSFVLEHKYSHPPYAGLPSQLLMGIPANLSECA